MARISRVGQFASFTTIVAGGMFTLGGMLLLLAKGSGDPAAEAIVLVASLVLATVAIGLGPGSVPYTLMGELFPPEYRTLGSCVVLVVRSFFQHLSSNILLESTYPKTGTPQCQCW